MKRTVAAVALVCLGLGARPALASGDFLVTSYGAKCDGAIVYGGVITKVNSAVISTPSHSFTSADVGATIALSVPTFNSHSSAPLTAFNSTIKSVSGGTATLTNPVSFSSNSAAARWYHTVDTTAIQNTLNAAYSANYMTPGGGRVVFPNGVCVTKQLTFYSNEQIVGASAGATVVMLANGANSDLFVGQNFSALTGTNSTGGISNFLFQNIQLDGNRGANTGSGAGTAKGAGDCVRFYGYNWYRDNVEINNCPADGWYTEWGTSAGSPINASGNIGSAGMEAHSNNTKFFYNQGYGEVFNGPHDSQESYTWLSGNGLGGILQGPTGAGSPLTLEHIHGYQNGGYDISLPFPYSSCTDCYAEGGMYLGSSNYTISDSNIKSLTLGKPGGGPVYDLAMNGDQVGTLNNVNGTGFGDSWVGGSVGSLTGAVYHPAYAINTASLPNSIANSLSLVSGSSYPAVLNQSNSSVTSFMNGGLVSQTWDAAGNVTAGLGGLLTTASNGFFYLGDMAGAPTGAPTPKTGASAQVYDTKNDRLWIRNPVTGSWKYIQAN